MKKVFLLFAIAALFSSCSEIGQGTFAANDQIISGMTYHRFTFNEGIAVVNVTLDSLKVAELRNKLSNVKAKP